ncbi:spore germination protein [Anaeromicropila herbilytica]|uniref:Spore germination protein n=1 Tax=Anaeromicropila herbilytica TaxID=2785025 RepID=A0A7R7EHF1_9FIRM|nr:spore germination protein [Anaeromicropila herbilytica]BCN28812.1 spore germination protein [Anaeromicropila herbilytica]
MDILHDQDNMVTAKISTNLKENIDILEALFVECSDVIKRTLVIGNYNKVQIYMIYIDGMVNKELLEEDTIKNLIFKMDDLPSDNQYEYIKEKGLRTADIGELLTMQNITQTILSGDTVLLIDGYDKAIKIASRFYPNRGVPETKTEVVVRGSKESFSEVLIINRSLIRRRIRDTKLKVKPIQVGVRSKTDISIMYIEDLVQEGLVDEIVNKINDYVIDGIFDSGMLEQLTESSWYSPFPQVQSTERPDKAASAILEGRVVVMVDCSPMVLLFPTTIVSFFQASDDYYNRWELASITRILRYIAAFFAIALPAFYISVINFQPEIIPTPLTLSLAAARDGVPFSVVIEVIVMEVAFELISEAGIRLPGPMGSTVGIVGGLIIGNSAVAANLVSPIIVIIVALTAICSFTIPNEAFAQAFRLNRYLLIILSAFLGFYGFLLGIMIIVTHLAGLKSFGIPYLIPFAVCEVDKNSETRDSILRFPTFALKERPAYANQKQKIKLRKKNK